MSSRKETGELTWKADIFGEKLYQQRARIALPILVRQAKAEHPITYEALADEMDMPNPRNLNYPLGAIGSSLEILSERWKMKIPLINVLVVNKHNGLPGEGISWFIKDKKVYEKSSTKQKREIVKEILSEIYTFHYWDDVLNDFELNPASSKKNKTLEEKAKKFRKGGESEVHKKLKKYVANHPDKIGLKNTKTKGEIEFSFPSADAVDVLFKLDKEWIGTEVKTKESGLEDILRGLYQCIKYKALIEAMQMVNQEPINARCILALGGKFPPELKGIKNTLGVEVVDNIKN